MAAETSGDDDDQEMVVGLVVAGGEVADAAAEADAEEDEEMGKEFLVLEFTEKNIPRSSGLERSSLLRKISFFLDKSRS